MDLIMNVAINDLAAAKTEGNEETMNALIHFLDYASAYPNAKIRHLFRKGILYLRIAGPNIFKMAP